MIELYITEVKKDLSLITLWQRSPANVKDDRSPGRNIFYTPPAPHPPAQIDLLLVREEMGVQSSHFMKRRARINIAAPLAQKIGSA